ncbi:MAG: alpha-hydroxy acid oxidase [Steroidobacteraceae bacterium]
MALIPAGVELVDVGRSNVPRARQAEPQGVDQLDGARASLRALPEVVEAVRGRADVLMDGGVRRGSDVLKALCLGARAVLIGRAYMYGLGAAGEIGVAQALSILRTDLERTMALVGCAGVTDLDRSFVDVPTSWPQGAGS